MPSSRRTLAVALAAAATLILPSASARAATVDTTGGTLHVLAAAAEANQIAVSLSGGILTITDAGAPTRLAAATGCSLPQAGRVTCSATGVGAIDVRAGDLDDTLSVTANLPAHLDGGPGRDTLTGGPAGDDLDGGLGADALAGGGGRDVADYALRAAPVAVDLGEDDAVQGEAGEGDRIDDDVEGAAGGAAADTLLGDGSANTLAGGAGDDRIDGRGGADRLHGDDGTDTVDYSARRSSVYVDLDGSADDGQSGEGDDVRPDVERVLGGLGDDRLTGTAAPDALVGNAGRDTLDGGGGNDGLDGGTGDDTLKGGTGDDALEGGDGTDALDGQSGDDALAGGANNDTLFGSDGNDTLDAGAGNDALDAGADDDLLLGGPGNDRAQAGEGADRLDGADGDDELRGGRGADAVSAGAGNDRLYGDDDADALDGGPGADQAWGGSGDDRLAGGDDGDRLNGEGGSDSLDGGAANDTLDAGWGDDVLVGADGNDTLKGSTGHDALDAGAGDDQLDGGDDADSLTAGDGADRLWGGGGDDTLDAGGGDDDLDAGDGADLLQGADGDDDLRGSGGADRVLGGPGTDRLSGGWGDDVLDGGAGADALDGDDGTDTVDYGARVAPVVVTIGAGSADDGEAGERDDVRGSVDVVIGGVGSDRLTGSGAPNTLDGGAGDDRLDGAAGDDTLRGGEGKDLIIGGPGRDGADGGNGNDHLSTNDGLVETLLCGAGKDVAVLDKADRPQKCETRKVRKPSGGTTTSGAPANSVPAGTNTASRLTGVRIARGKGRFVTIPGTNEKIDRRILGDLTWMMAKYKLRVTAGFALHGHERNGEHPIGLGVDLVPGAGGSWGAVDRLARWAEPRQGRPRAPFRWVGYNGDAGHGRGHHLHLSWRHAKAKRGRPAAWVQHLVFRNNAPIRIVAGGVFGRLGRASNARLGGVPSVRTGLRAVTRCQGAAQLRSTWKAAGKAFGIRWSILAGITEIESGHGCNMGPSSAGAIGWTQFMPATWKHWGMDADGDKKASAYNSVDAIFSSARYLRASGAPKSYRKALFAYNHAKWYVDGVLQRAKKYR